MRKFKISGRKLAYDFIEREEQEEIYNKEAEVKMQDHIKKIDNTKTYCSECGKELNLGDKMYLDDICRKCILNYYY